MSDLARFVPAVSTARQPRAPQGILVAAAGACFVLLVVLSAGFVEQHLVTSGAELNDRDLACLKAVRLLYGLLGVALLVAAAEWRALFAPLSASTLIVFSTPILGVAAIVGSKILYFGFDPPFYHWLTHEDSVFEWGTVVAYAAAFFVTLGIVPGFLRRGEWLLGALFALLAVAFFFVAGEEVSWGQRIFGLVPPDAFATKLQGEITVHKMPGVAPLVQRAFILVGLLGGLAWMAVPIVSRIRPLAWLERLAPAWTLAPWFLSVSIIYIFLEFATPRPGNDGQLFFGCFTYEDQEIVECFLSVGFFLFVYAVRRRQRAEFRSAGRV